MSNETYNPKNPDLYKQVELPPPTPPSLNIVPLAQNQSTLNEGAFLSKNFRTGRSGFRLQADGTLEARNGIFSGTFNIGGTQITVDNVDDVQEALDRVYAEGGGTVFLQPGTYTLTADITIPSGVTLQGINRDSVIINCNTSYAVKIVGTNVYSTGTVTLNNGDTTVVGSGTTWTSAMVGRYILLDGLWYEITAFTDTTHITIETYQGDNLSGSAYVLADTNFNAQIRKVTVTGATGSGIVVQYAMESNLFDLVVYGNGTGIEMDYVTYPIIQVTSNENGVGLNMNFVEGFFIDFSEFSYSTTGNGITMNEARNATFFNSSVNDNTGDGINMTSCDTIAFISFDISGNGGQGIEEVSGCNDNQFTNGLINGNTSDGIKLTATTDRNTFTAISLTNNGGYGINIAASTCDNNQIIAPAFDSNTSGNVNDSGTNTIVLPESGFAFTAAENISANDAVAIASPNTHAADFEASSSQFFDAGDTVPLSITGNFTIEFWVNFESLSDYEGIVAKSDEATQKSYEIRGRADGDLDVVLSSNGSTEVVKTYNTNFSTATWYHVAVVYTAASGAVEVFKDGSSVSSQSGMPTSIHNSTATFKIGTTQGGGSQFDGLIDDVRVWNTIRTSTQISDLKSVQLLGSETGLVGYWRLNNSLLDSSSNGATLTNNNGATFTTSSAFTPTAAGTYMRKADASNQTTSAFLGFSPGAVTSGNSGNVKLSGVLSGFSSLSVGSLYYLSDTGGSISTTPGTVSQQVGRAISSTQLLIT